LSFSKKKFEYMENLFTKYGKITKNKLCNSAKSEKANKLD